MTEKPVITLAEAEAKGFPVVPPKGSDRFGSVITPIGPVIGTKALGCMLHVVEPGKTAFPFHCHHGNEELFVILSGSGEYRIGEARYPVSAGDICAAPAGGPETAHQLSNTGEEPLKYLGLSTKNDPDVVEYPDSGKFACAASARKRLHVRASDVSGSGG